ncbi:methyltransferase domain-containing protein [Amycolatopsis sp. NPDC026612]|uniref:class I SAM-dependent methyltransferase n=1 Tax=Amycolatopsis sp. NPDC026612 TaxID=3155466 RepID=UPI0033E40D84
MTSDLWDAQAETFDDQPDHGLRDAAVRDAWADLLLPLLPPAPAAVVDLGCGTGSLSLLLAEAGHDVCGADFSTAMLGQARRKAAGLEVDFRHGDAADPPCPDRLRRRSRAARPLGHARSRRRPGEVGRLAQVR